MTSYGPALYRCPLSNDATGFRSGVITPATVGWGDLAGVPVSTAVSVGGVCTVARDVGCVHPERRTRATSASEITTTGDPFIIFKEILKYSLLQKYINLLFSSSLV
jgi:hypothetical protein